MREHVRPSLTRAEDVVANASGENFPVALRMLPARYRRHLTNLYFFARLTDDLGDEARPDTSDDPKTSDTELRLKLLDELAADVDRIYDGGTPESPVMRAMAETVGECHMPAKPLRDLIQANRQDQLVTRYPGYAELARYCELSANPVGQIVLYIFGVATPGRIALSDSICTALQLAEHWQDVAEDLGNGRIYLPAEDMERYGCHGSGPGRADGGPRRPRADRLRGRPRRAATESRRAASRHAARSGQAGGRGLPGGRPGRAGRDPGAALRRADRNPAATQAEAGRGAGPGVREREVSRR